MNPDSNVATLIDTPMRAGRVVWIGVRPGRRKPIEPRDVVQADERFGLAGDRYAGRSGKRQVTLIQAEHIAAIASHLGEEDIHPGLLRRNVVTRGINLRALKDRNFRVGDAVLAYTGECHPCSRMEENLGIGGYNAVRGHGGITARVVTGGRIRLDDEIVWVPGRLQIDLTRFA